MPDVVILTADSFFLRPLRLDFLPQRRREVQGSQSTISCRLQHITLGGARVRLLTPDS